MKLPDALIKKLSSGRTPTPDDAQPARVAALGQPDLILLFITAALLAVGFIMVFSASSTLGMKVGDSLYYLKRQVLYLAIGGAALGVAMMTDYRSLKRWSVLSVSSIIFLLFLVFLPGIGRSSGGAVRWIDLTLFSFQPSEAAKIIVIIYLAQVLSSWKGDSGGTLKILLIALAPVLLISFLVLRQPDLGTMMVISGSTFLMLVLSGLSGRYLLGIGAFGFFSVLLLSLTSAYRFRRIVAFIDPWKAPFDVGFHIIQSLLAVGSGGIFGLGLGGSKQKFFYLPQHYSDFMYAMVAEELGFLGAVGVIILFILFAVRGMRIARFAADDFGCLLASGITSWLTLQALINIFVVVGLFPTTGIPLPFISFGGTALIVALFAVGVLLNISRTISN